MRSLFKSLIILVLTSSLCQFSYGSGTQRAIVIGIDIYNPSGVSGRWMNLDGCANDALSVKQVLESRYGFPAENITELYNANASRANILKAYDELLNVGNKGDIVVIYYAGHGSQVKNSLSEEKDQKDESMVPADSYLGTPDIRDKELAEIFNKFADKGIILTVIYDCCHSGSIGRGLATNNPPKLRHIEEDPNVDAKDASMPAPPENRGVLIMSASQDFEFASEQIDENGVPHGAFTIALLQSLSTLAVNATAVDIFNSARAILKYNGKTQEPVLAANQQRKVNTIFGIEKGQLSGKTQAPVLDVNSNEITLQGGFAIGIYPESELFCIKGDSKVSVKVKNIDGISKVTAVVTDGDATLIKPGDLFELKNWHMAEGSTLKVYVSKSPYTLAQILETAKNLNTLGLKKDVTVISDPVKDAPDYTVFFSDGNWYLGLPDNKVINLGSKPDTKIISKNLVSGSKLYINLPPPQNLESSLKSAFSEENAVEAVQSSANAQYFLTGRMVDNQLEYAFFIPQVSENDSGFSNTLPLRTNYFPLNENSNSIKMVVDSLSEYTLRIAKIKSWLTLAPPPDDGSFPFRLVIKNSTTGELITGNNQVKIGDILGFYLALDKANENEWDKTRRYIYVFSIDSKGKMSLWFPLTGNVENRGPWFDSQANIIELSPLGRSKLLRVTEPIGTDTYILLATNEPIPNPDVLNQPGVMTRGSSSGYSQLLSIGSRTRGSLITPSDWGMQKIVIKSTK